jgi:hypothetical protein
VPPLCEPPVSSAFFSSTHKHCVHTYVCTKLGRDTYSACAALAVGSCHLYSYFAYVSTPITLVLEDRPLVIIATVHSDFQDRPTTLSDHSSRPHTHSLTHSLAPDHARAAHLLTMSRARTRDLSLSLSPTYKYTLTLSTKRLRRTAVAVLSRFTGSGTMG